MFVYTAYHSILSVANTVADGHLTANMYPLH